MVPAISMFIGMALLFCNVIPINTNMGQIIFSIPTLIIPTAILLWYSHTQSKTR